MIKSKQLIPRFAEAISRLGGDEGLLREMAAITSADLPEVINETDQALCAGKSDQAASGLHKLKGMLSTFETGGATIEIEEMLSFARHREVAKAKTKFDHHRSEIDELVAEIALIATESFCGSGFQPALPIRFRKP
ncbi:hypothetical protein Q31b_18350 [Novipirellula aureliae]|uniref:HPt domain-containing protein n=1 Tax=Novipirellula aureliae TaxID=2527966 RepID=A0A5C6EAV5_9BACT|nr:hypothetical protein [Novipirellula aureliae]TWU44299.1 hypothetical protein Q31b_18350 [Novipirellula aureliae]